MRYAVTVEVAGPVTGGLVDQLQDRLDDAPAYEEAHVLRRGNGEVTFVMFDMRALRPADVMTAASAVITFLPSTIPWGWAVRVRALDATASSNLVPAGQGGLEALEQV